MRGLDAPDQRMTSRYRLVRPFSRVSVAARYLLTGTERAMKFRVVNPHSCRHYARVA